MQVRGGWWSGRLELVPSESAPRASADARFSKGAAVLQPASHVGRHSDSFQRSSALRGRGRGSAGNTRGPSPRFAPRLAAAAPVRTSSSVEGDGRLACADPPPSSVERRRRFSALPDAGLGELERVAGCDPDGLASRAADDGYALGVRLDRLAAELHRRAAHRPAVDAELVSAGVREGRGDLDPDVPTRVPLGGHAEPSGPGQVLLRLRETATGRTN